LAPYRVNLDIFAGPLDLLLYLVRKDEVDIYDIEISKVTGEYIKHIELLQLFDIEVAGDFLVLAATLMEIKSAMLLPRVQEESEEETENTDPRAELVRQLLEYKKFKDAANMLDESASVRENRFTRPDVIISKLKPQEEPELDLDEVSIWTLLEAFDGIMQATGSYQSYEHISDDTSIDFYQIEVLHRLQTEGPRTFAELFKDKSNKLQMIGVFLGMLELMKSELIWVEQSECVGEIRIRAKTEVPAEQAVQDAIYKNMEEEALALEKAGTPENAEGSENAENSENSEVVEITDSADGFEDVQDEAVEPVEFVENEIIPDDSEEVAEIGPAIPIMELPAVEENAKSVSEKIE
jgi:segregation and condensation protein A